MIRVNTRKPTNLSLDPALLLQAKELKVNLSRAAEKGIRQAVQQSRAAQWQTENRAALDSSNRFVEGQGLPLHRLRQF